MHGELDGWTGRPAVMWWRDDDAVAATPALDRLLAIHAETGLPLAIASVPALLDSSLVRALRHVQGVRVLAHGWDHRNHEPAGAPSAELGPGRNRQIRDELRAGYARLTAAFGSTFLPVLVPPFNRIHRSVVPVVREAGFRMISIDGDFTGLPMPSRNIHVDVNDWRTGRAAALEPAMRGLIGALRLRRLGLVARTAPIGILTHHLAHDESSWQLTVEFLHHLGAHHSVAFRPLEEIFA